MLSNIKSFTLYISIYLCIQMQSNALALPSFFLKCMGVPKKLLVVTFRIPKIAVFGSRPGLYDRRIDLCLQMNAAGRVKVN